MKTYILNVPFDCITRKEALERLLGFLKEEKYHMVFTPNPEIVLEANNDEEFMRILKSADLVIPDGIGIVLASKLNKIKIKQRVAGCDLIEALFKAKSAANESLRIYLLGSKPGIAKQAKKNIEKKYPSVKIVGLNDGYFDANKEKIIIEQIQSLKPDLLLVGTGFPRQEKWIYNNRKCIPAKIAIGCGGSIDIYGGAVKRAPIAFQKFGLEWFYRLILEPTRIKRMLKLPLFAIKCIILKINPKRKT